MKPYREDEVSDEITKLNMEPGKTYKFKIGKKLMIKIIELPIELPPSEVEALLSQYKYLHSYPLEYKKADEGYVKVIRYFVEEKSSGMFKKNKDK